jgi:2-polyprenyl-6-methoxyphenol hydroxylase-like FAD-dependent oxidoreductase
VRGEQMHCWGVAEARTLGLYELLLETCGHEVRYWSDRLVGFSEFGRRDLVKTSPHRAGSLNFYHPDMQSVVIGAAAAAGATVRRGARVVELVSGGPPGVRVHEDGNGERVYRARRVVGADGRNSLCRRWGGLKGQQATCSRLIRSPRRRGVELKSGTRSRLPWRLED